MRDRNHNTNGSETMGESDFIESTTARLLAAARRSGFFRDAIADAEEFHRDGYVWDVALAMSCDFWCR